MKKIVLPVRDGRIDVTVGNAGEILGVEYMPSPQGCGCKSGVAAVFKEKGITVMLAGNMGMGALNKLNDNGITVVRGCNGPVMDVVNDYLAGRLSDSGESCRHHHEGEEHSCHEGGGWHVHNG